MSLPAPAPNPIFVYGALRSGTTLLHLMLDGHSSLYSASEADYLFDHISPDPAGPGGWRYDTDALGQDWIFREISKLKVPEGLQGTDLTNEVVTVLTERAAGQQLSVNIHRNAPRMAALFPEARIIHLLRDPRDVARSSVGMGWSGNSYFGAKHWIDTEQDWEAAGIPAEQVLEVRFEELISNLEVELTRICDFLGLEFDPGMLDYHKNSTYDPPNPKIAQKWRQKASPRAIALLEGRIGPLLEARGYEPAGAPATPGAVESLKLALEHRLNRWRFNIRRYGAGLFFGRHAARALKLKSLEARLAAKQEVIHIQHLK